MESLWELLASWCESVRKKGSKRSGVSALQCRNNVFASGEVINMNQLVLDPLYDGLGLSVRGSSPLSMKTLIPGTSTWTNMRIVAREEPLDGRPREEHRQPTSVFGGVAGRPC